MEVKLVRFVLFLLLLPKKKWKISNLSIFLPVVFNSYTCYFELKPGVHGPAHKVFLREWQY